MFDSLTEALPAIGVAAMIAAAAAVGGYFLYSRMTYRCAMDKTITA